MILAECADWGFPCFQVIQEVAPLSLFFSRKLLCCCMISTRNGCAPPKMFFPHYVSVLNAPEMLLGRQEWSIQNSQQESDVFFRHLAVNETKKFMFIPSAAHTLVFLRKQQTGPMWDPREVMHHASGPFAAEGSGEGVEPWGFFVCSHLWAMYSVVRFIFFADSAIFPLFFPFLPQSAQTWNGRCNEFRLSWGGGTFFAFLAKLGQCWQFFVVFFSSFEYLKVFMHRPDVPFRPNFSSNFVCLFLFVQQFPYLFWIQYPDPYPDPDASFFGIGFQICKIKFFWIVLIFIKKMWMTSQSVHVA